MRWAAEGDLHGPDFQRAGFVQDPHGVVVAQIRSLDGKHGIQRPPANLGRYESAHEDLRRRAVFRLQAERVLDAHQQLRQAPLRLQLSHETQHASRAVALGAPGQGIANSDLRARVAVLLRDGDPLQFVQRDLDLDPGLVRSDQRHKVRVERDGGPEIDALLLDDGVERRCNGAARQVQLGPLQGRLG